MTKSSLVQPMQALSSRRSVLLGAVGLGVMATTLTACSSGNPTLYTLSVVPGQPMPGGPRYVEVRQPSIASGLDRDRIVTQDTGYKLTVASADAWGDSLGGQISRMRWPEILRNVCRGLPCLRKMMPPPRSLMPMWTSP